MLNAHIQLTDQTSVGEARRAGHRIASALGMSEVKAGELGILITEAARNTVVHGKGGHLVISGYDSNQGRLRIDVLALDKGPGIKDLGKSLQDGYSTAGTPGTGLGAIQRMATTFDVFSNKEGTALLAQVAEPAEASSRNTLELAGVAVPLSGELFCGDALDWEQKPERTIIMVIDGLGHGREAAEASEEGIRIFRKYNDEAPASILSRMHDALKKTRGAAASIAEIRPLAGSITYAGVGNISATIVSHSGTRSLVSHNGTLGHVMARLQEFKMDWPREGVLIMHSDGLQTRWDLSKYAGLLARNPALIAGVLLRDFRRQRDDSSVLVCKGRS